VSVALRRGNPPAPSQAGFALIEVVVSALIVVLTTGGVISLLNASGHASARERSKAQAFSLAQEDQARLRSTSIGELQTTMAPRTETLNGVTYTIVSTAHFVSDSTGNSTKCGGTSSETSADYVRIGSEVTWPNMQGSVPVKLESIVSPVSGSLNPSHGNLAVTVVNASNQKISGVGLSGSGPGVFSGSTDSEGCALFAGEPAGNYTLTPSLPAGYVNKNGEPPEPIQEGVSVTAGTTTPIELIYDRESTVELGFEAKSSGGVYKPATSDSVVAVNSELQSGAKAFWTASKKPEGIVKATPLFPFASPNTYTFYAGSCSTNKPTEGSASVVAPAAETVKATIKIPALTVTVKNSSGGLVNGAKVTTTDTTCPSAIKHEYFTGPPYNPTENGITQNPIGLPYGTYTICASAVVSGSTKRVTVSSKELHSLNNTAITMNLPSTSGSSC
jgi:Tfp pilus assembly protein PilV